MKTVPDFPVYIASKSRAATGHTPRFLDRIEVPYRLVVEQEQYADYERYFPASKLLVLDPQFQEDYETCDDLAGAKSRGPGPARNFIWEHALAAGAERHWVLDDNIRYFMRLHRNERIVVGDGTIFRAMEDFSTRYTNVALAGPAYMMFVPSRLARPPFITNTRVYSCLLIRNDLPFRWRGRYNEDTDLALRALKAGWVTVQFNAFLQHKFGTKRVAGGNTEAFYAEEGTLPKSEMLVRLHPDVARLTWRFNRWHHYVDYSGFADNRLVRRPDYVPPETNPYQLRRVERYAGEKGLFDARAPQEVEPR